jgi:uncharacterized repeat protein (TIGR01451 family)
MIMRILNGLCAALAVTAAMPVLAASPVQVVTKVMAEQRSAAADGTTRIALVPAAHVTPGDRVVYQIDYRNSGAQAIDNFVVSNPLPQGIAYLSPAAGSPEPELSVDGSTYAPLAVLKVSGPKGVRPATLGDVKSVRWRLAQPLAAGGHGAFAFRAMLR